MRNWNLRFLYKLWRFRHSFQTTYEELKRVSGLTNTPAFSLPDYLWGIETQSSRRSLARPGLRLPDYLWGIETRRCQRDPSESWASRLPMRNWNLCTFFRLSQKISLPDYLWGIETRKWYAENKERVKGFQTTYEELKLYLSMWLYLSWASRLPMRNWN